MQHDQARCHLGVGMRWRDCDCAEIHPNDRPCITCEALTSSALDCNGCRELAEGRSLHRQRLELPLDGVLPLEQPRSVELAARRWRACPAHGISPMAGCSLCNLFARRES